MRVAIPFASLAFLAVLAIAVITAPLWAKGPSK